MPTLFEHLAMRIAWMHAGRVYRRFMRAARQARQAQQAALRALVRRHAGSDLDKQFGLSRIRTLRDLRAHVPIMSFDDLRPFIDRVMHGDARAMFRPGARVRMFAVTSGTTSASKHVPVTDEFIREYRRGWNTFGCKMLADHPDAILRHILQCSGRHDEARTPAGIPCGAITGLLARTQKRIVRRFYVGGAAVGRIEDVRTRHYVLMRLAVERDVAFAVTANPATLIQLARVADEESERLIRDVRDGSITPPSGERIPDMLPAAPTANASLARRLDELRRVHGCLRPRDYWRLSFVSCWIGGSMGLYLDRLCQWYGNIPVRDPGLLASEGRVTIPMDDNTAVGVLDAPGAVFEFIPLAEEASPDPTALLPWELETGKDYIVVLSNPSGLLRYRLDDVVRAHGFIGEAPLLEFRHRAGGVASIAGEKLTEAQVVSAVAQACREFRIPEFDYVAMPCWDDPPRYRVDCEANLPENFAELLDVTLCRQNSEYKSRRSSSRLGCVLIRSVPSGTIARQDENAIRTRGTRPEQYKRQCLVTAVGGSTVEAANP